MMMSSFLLRRIPLRAKHTTGLTGVPVELNPHDTLSVLYGKILHTIQRIPDGVAYKRHTGDIISQRLAIVKANENIAKLEATIGSGQVEEIIIQAKNELELAKNMLEWRPWEPLVQEPPLNQWKWPIV